MTSRAWVLSALFLIGLGAGLWLQWIVLVSICASLLTFVFATHLLRFPRSGNWSDIAAPTRVTRGDSAHVAISVTLSPAAPRWVSAVNSVGGVRTFVPRNGDLEWIIDTSRRGQFVVGPDLLEACDPWGIRRRVLAERALTSVLVVPRVRPLTELAGLGEAESAVDSERAGSDVFHSLREYVVGDPVKSIHWKSSARAGTLMVKRTVDTTIPWLLVVLDVNARAYDKASALFEDFDDEAFEESVDAVASWAWHSCGSGQRVLLTTTGMSGQSGLLAEVDVRNRERSLDLLALVEPEEPARCGPLRIDALMQRNGVRSVVFVTGRRLEHSARWVSRWRNRAQVRVVVGHS